jgi:uncharacterized protein (TIGR01244 family)
MIRLALLAILGSCALLVQAADTRATLSELPQARFPVPNRVVSGAIDASHIDLLKRAGIRHVVNLRPADENPTFDEARAVEEQGLEYHAVPVKGAQSLTRENARALDRILKEIGDEPALLHCSSGNRVGALVAVREAWINGKSPEEAVAIGKEWGLTSLDGAVRTRFEERP